MPNSVPSSASIPASAASVTVQPMKLSASEAPTLSVLLPTKNRNEIASWPVFALAAISAVASISAWSVRAWTMMSAASTVLVAMCASTPPRITLIASVAATALADLVGRIWLPK